MVESHGKQGRLNGLNREALARLYAREDAIFRQRTQHSARLAERAERTLPNGVPMAWMRSLYGHGAIYAASGEGAFFKDVDGNAYCDFNVCDLAMTMGYGPPAIARAVSEQMAQGAHFLLATEAAIDVAEELANRCGLPFWQFTTTASAANTEVMRTARALTGRKKIVVFGGHYHGHIDETLAHDSNGRAMPDQDGNLPGASDHTVIVPFNDLPALEAALAGGDVALVLTEPALTNCLLVLPDAGFLSGVRELTLRFGALLCLDEAHTFSFAYGGLVRAWGLQSDFIVLGKGFGTGISFALYGMSAEVGARYAARLDDGRAQPIATGGTTYASALAVVAARAALQDVLTPEAYDRVTMLGHRLADGLEQSFAARGLDWRAFRLGPRSGYCMFPALPRNGREAAASIDRDFIAARRLYMANRGVWDAIWSSGPQVSFAHTQQDIDQYITLSDSFLAAIVA